jgi:hypothetical protein
MISSQTKLDIKANLEKQKVDNKKKFEGAFFIKIDGDSDAVKGDL